MTQSIVHKQNHIGIQWLLKILVSAYVGQTQITNVALQYILPPIVFHLYQENHILIESHPTAFLDRVMSKDMTLVEFVWVFPEAMN
eukprot:snap_masked-scaffold_10-processed-gene-4.46-mRNA-1 protein AED:1.00 eAED:1.00 QI:0/0/0/0/1/1/2/0/85